MRLIAIAFFAALSGASLYAFITRYWLYRDCIHAAASSCLTPEGGNLTSGGMLWGAVSLVFATAAIVLIVRKILRG